MGEGDEADEDERKREEAKAAEGGGAELREGLGARRDPNPNRMSQSAGPSSMICEPGKRLPIVLPIVQPPPLTSPFIVVAASIAVATPWPSSSLQNRCC